MLVGRTWHEIMSKTQDLERLRNPRGCENDKAKIR